MQHILDRISQKNELESLFQKMYDGDAILLLGAGASVSNKRYLSSEIMDYYKEQFHIDDDTSDIVEFVDNLSSNPQFRRADFDLYVAGLLRKLAPSNVHSTIMSIPWRQILTTNFDLLLERAE